MCSHRESLEIRRFGGETAFKSQPCFRFSLEIKKVNAYMLQGILAQQFLNKYNVNTNWGKWFSIRIMLRKKSWSLWSLVLPFTDHSVFKQHTFRKTVGLIYPSVSFYLLGYKNVVVSTAVPKSELIKNSYLSWACGFPLGFFNKYLTLYLISFYHYKDYIMHCHPVTL